MASYPSNVVVFTTHTNLTEVIDASHPNNIQAEVVAVQSTLGANPHISTTPSSSGTFTGTSTTYSSLAARLANIETGIVSDAHVHYLHKTGGDTIQSSSTGVVGVTFQAITSQTADFINLKNVGGTTIAKWDVSGNVTAVAGTFSGALASASHTVGGLSVLTTSHVDTDGALTSLHHTLGTGGFQAAAGNHAHAGVYSAVGHSHLESDITSLTTDLGNKSAVGHTHVNANITDIGSASVNHATYAAYIENDSANMRLHYAGQGGQPSWLWGTNDGVNAYVYNPSNFSVNFANSAASANSVAWGAVSGKPLSNIRGGETTVSFSGGAGSLGHGLGFTPAGAVVTKVDGGNDSTYVSLNGPTAWDNVNLYLRCNNGTSGTTGNVTVGWIAFG